MSTFAAAIRLTLGRLALFSSCLFVFGGWKTWSSPFPLCVHFSLPSALRAPKSSRWPLNNKVCACVEELEKVVRGRGTVRGGSTEDMGDHLGTFTSS